MPAANSLRIIATGLGISGALIELYLGAIVAFGAGTGIFRGFAVMIVPIFILFGAVMIRVMKEADLGAGIMIIATAIHHNFIDIKLFALLPLGLIALASALAFFVETQRRRFERPSEQA
jgi:hypothetical protein